MNTSENSIYEVIREFKLHIEGVSHPIYGQILKEVKADNGSAMRYRWEISHYYKPEATSIEAYRPSRDSAESEEDAKRLLFLYAEKFTAIDIEANPYY